MTQQAIQQPQTVNLSLTPPKSVLEQNGFCDAVASTLGITSKVVVPIVGGILRSLRVSQRDNPLKVADSLGAELEHCAKAYCGAIRTDEDVFEEATEFILGRFGHLGVFEIREAFRLATSGQLGDIDLKAYYGSFTIVALGAVLRAYDIYRMNIVKEIRRREVLVLSAQREADKQVSWNTEAWAAERRDKLLLLEDPNAEYITAHDFDWLTRAGELNPTKEAKEKAWVEAKQMVIEDYQAIGQNNRSFRMALEDVLAGKSNEGFYTRRVAAMKRLLVVGWIEAMQESDKQKAK